MIKSVDTHRVGISDFCMRGSSLCYQDADKVWRSTFGVFPDQAVVSASLEYHEHTDTSEILGSTNLGIYRGQRCNKEDFESCEAVGVATHVLQQRYTLLDLTKPCRYRPTDIASSSQLNSPDQLPPRLAPNMPSSR
jgi:hypothetical protein